MKICIIGGGHIGTTLAGYLSNMDNDNVIFLHSNKPERFNSEQSVKVNDIEKEITYTAYIDCVTNDYQKAVTGADVIFVTLPHFLIDSCFCNISPYVKTGAMIGVVPGSGGVEFIYKKYFTNEIILFGFQRVPFTAKLVEYGKETNLKSWKPSVQVASIPLREIDNVCNCVAHIINPSQRD